MRQIQFYHLIVLKKITGTFPRLKDTKRLYKYMQYLMLSWTLYQRESESEVAQSCPTLCYPMDCSPPGSSVHGIYQARIWVGLPFPSPGDLLNPGIEPRSPALQADALTSAPPRSLQGLHNNNVSCMRTVSGWNLLANYVILKCKLWKQVWWGLYNLQTFFGFIGKYITPLLTLASGYSFYPLLMSMSEAFSISFIL